MPAFECRLKADRSGMPKGTTIQVFTKTLTNCPQDKIADECERLFGKRARDASYPGYWDIKKL